ncbi:transposase [bacterium]|nr:transposase [bacterium]
MARPLRIEYKDAHYHVMNRGHRGLHIFEDASDYRDFQKLLKELVDVYHVCIIAYCLMPNHYHLFVKTPLGKLSRPMRHLNGVYTQKFNRKHGLDGPLFRGRFKSIIVDRDTYYLELIRYIHRNPVRAGLESIPGKYPWSSHSAYLSQKPEDAWVEREEALSRFGRNHTQQIKEYLQFVALDDSEGVLRELNRTRWHQTMGSQEFRNEFKRRFLQDKPIPEKPQSRELMREVIEIQEIVASKLKVTVESLKNGNRGKTNEERTIAVYLSSKYSGKTHYEVAKEFNSSRSTMVGSAIQRVRKQLDRCPEFREKVLQLEDVLSTFKNKP